MTNKRIFNFSFLGKPTQSEIESRELRLTLYVMISAIVIAVIFSVSFMVYGNIIKIADKLPDINYLKTYKPQQSSLIYDINNKLIANIQGDEDRVVVPLNRISPELQKAVIAIEDNRFYDHKGIDLTGTLRAAVRNFSGSDSVQGGSTLTQQLVKNSFLSPERTIKRKIIEAILSMRIETAFSKDKILEMYLNEIYWGNMSYGAEKAAKRYFKKSANNLDIAESALLAGLIKGPEAYSPYRHYKLAKLRQKLVLERMEHYGYITHKQRVDAEKEPLKLCKLSYAPSKYPYFVSYVSYLLNKNYGEDVVKKGGLKIYTTVDPQVQELAERTVSEGVKSVPENSGITQGALVSINVKNGYIQALVGGVDFYKSNYNRATQARRALGSSFKPVVYLTGLRTNKITPDSPITDAPISLRTRWNVWSPHNWDGKYLGKMNVRKALTLSRNTPTVRVALKVGVDNIIQTARLLGIKSHIDRNFSIVLGSFGISPLEMVTVYSTLAREGAYIEPAAIRRVEDMQGNVLEEHNPNPVQVVNRYYVRELNSILIDVVEKGTGKLAKLDDRQVAGKTGTTDDVRDIWFTGFTPDTATTIWMGNDSNSGLKNVFSSNCAQLWGIFSKEYYKLKHIPASQFVPPDNISNTKVKIDNKEKKTDQSLPKIIKDQNTDKPLRKKASKKQHSDNINPDELNEISKNISKHNRKNHEKSYHYRPDQKASEDDSLDTDKVRPEPGEPPVPGYEENSLDVNPKINANEQKKTEPELKPNPAPNKN